MLAAKHIRRSSPYLTYLPSSPKKTFLKKWKLDADGWAMTCLNVCVCVCVCTWYIRSLPMWDESLSSLTCSMDPRQLPLWSSSFWEQGVCVTLWPCHLHLKSLFRQKKNYGNSKYFTMQKYKSPKKSSKRNQNPSRYYNYITNLKFQHKPKYIIFQKSSYKTRPIYYYYYLGAKNPLSYYTR